MHQSTYNFFESEKIASIAYRKHNANLKALVEWATNSTSANPYGVREYFKSWHGLAVDLAGAKQSVLDCLVVDSEYFDEY